MKIKQFFADFKAFAMKGNILDMAVGVVVGGAFSKIVTGFVNYIINPFVGIFLKSGSLDSIKTVITPEELDAATGEVLVKEVAILWGTWLQTIIDFLIIAFCIFLMVKGITKLTKKKEEEKPATPAPAPEPEPSAEEKLLTEIRDLLKNKQ